MGLIFRALLSFSQHIDKHIVFYFPEKTTQQPIILITFALVVPQLPTVVAEFCKSSVCIVADYCKLNGTKVCPYYEFLVH